MKENSLTQNLKNLKAANPTVPTQELETQIASAKAEKENIGAVYDSIK